MSEDFSKSDIASTCRKWAGEIYAPLPGLVTPAQLLWAIAGNESSFGANCTPRYETAYDAGGKYVDVGLTKRYGKAAACSYGPWQILLTNCPPQFSPNMLKNLDGAAEATIYFLNKQIDRYHPVTLAEIGAIWNGGNPKALERQDVRKYVQRLEQNYSVPMVAQLPAAVGG